MTNTGQSRRKRQTPAERIVSNVRGMSPNLQQYRVMYWLDLEFGGNLDAPQPELAASLRERASHEESVTMTWEELAIIVNTATHNSRPR